ncbi:hypothetical protein TNCV_2643001 [Trichonephila clavipes]|nr:hypothetical protein TNCV_2643001 [Trichonephila clavipes]
MLTSRTYLNRDGNTEHLAGSQRPIITSSREKRHVSLMVLIDRTATSRAQNWGRLQDKCLHEQFHDLCCIIVHGCGYP